eukprot:1239383-Pleurochrysis_carterae.AAC.3
MEKGRMNGSQGARHAARKSGEKKVGGRVRDEAADGADGRDRDRLRRVLLPLSLDLFDVSEEQQATKAAYISVFWVRVQRARVGQFESCYASNQQCISDHAMRKPAVQ